MADTEKSVPQVAALDEKAIRLETAVAQTAQADPFPGPLKAAFLDGPVKIGSPDNQFVVRKIVAADWKFFRQLDSPFLKMIVELQKEETLRENIPWTDEEEWEAIWQLTHPPREVRDALAKGREEFRKMCVEEIGDSEKFSAVKELLLAAVMEQLRRHMLTKLHYTAEAEKGDLSSFFASLPKPETPTK